MSPYLELLGGLHLRGLGEVLNLGLAEDDVGVAGGILVHVRLLDDEQDVLGLPDRHPGNASHLHRINYQLTRQLYFISGADSACLSRIRIFLSRAIKAPDPSSQRI